MDSWRGSWIQLKRLVGIDPATPTASQEGQIRYVRADGDDGALYVARGRADDSREWAGLSLTVRTAAAIQPAITAVGAAGGGTVTLAPGTYSVSGLLIDSDVWLRGSGVNATTLRATSGTNYPVLLTREFADHTGTDDTDSEVNFKISDLTINGNKAQCSGTNGYGIRVHAANYSLERLRIYDCNAVGIDSEWSSSAGAPSTPGMRHAMEARLIDVEVHECDGDGITWNGPHDSMWWGVITWQNGVHGVSVQAKGNALIAHACHSWGNNQETAFLLESTGCELNGCTGEGASYGQVVIRANDNRIIGGTYFGAGAASPVGIRLEGAAGYMITTKLLNCDDGALLYDGDFGLGWIEALVYQATGTAESGTPDVSSKRDIRVFGGASGTVDV